MGLALRAVVDAMGQWGAEWLEIEPRHLDPAYVLWATLKLVDLDRIPAQTTVIRFELRDRPADDYWLILRRPQPELCTHAVGYAEDIVCHTDSATLVDLHLKRLDYPPRSGTRVSTWPVRHGSPASSGPGSAPARSPTTCPPSTAVHDLDPTNTCLDARKPRELVT